MEPRQVSKLFSEVSVLRELDHPHIVRMRQVFYSKVRKFSMSFCYVEFLTSGGTVLYWKHRGWIARRRCGDVSLLIL